MPLVLIVDDEHAIVETLAEVLRTEGYAVATAANGALALEAMRAQRPDVVLLDYMMPVLDGAQALAEMRSDAALATIPVVMMSAATESAVGTTPARQAFLRKPFRAPALLAAIAAVVGPAG